MRRGKRRDVDIDADTCLGLRRYDPSDEVALRHHRGARRRAERARDRVFEARSQGAGNAATHELGSEQLAP